MKTTRMIVAVAIACFLSACGHKNEGDADKQLADLQAQIDQCTAETAVYTYRAEHAGQARVKYVEVPKIPAKEICATTAPTPIPAYVIRQQIVEELKKIVPPSAPKEVVTAPSVTNTANDVPLSDKQLAKEMVATPTPAPKTAESEQFVNIMLVDNQGLPTECHKWVRLSNVKIKGSKIVSFQADDKTISCNDNKGLAVSFSYTNGDNPTVEILWPTADGNAAVKVLSSDIYRSIGGTIWYDNSKGGFAQAPQGAKTLVMQ